MASASAERRDHRTIAAYRESLRRGVGRPGHLEIDEQRQEAGPKLDVENPTLGQLLEHRRVTSQNEAPDYALGLDRIQVEQTVDVPAHHGHRESELANWVEGAERLTA